MICTYQNDHIEYTKDLFQINEKLSLSNGIFPCPNLSCNSCIKPENNFLLQIKYLMVDEAIKTICRLSNEQLLNYDKTYFYLKKNILEEIITNLAFIKKNNEIKSIDNLDFYNIDTEGEKLIQIILALLSKNQDLVTPNMITRISICKSNKLKLIFRKYL